MSALAIWTLALGALKLAASGACLAAPELMHEKLRALPRHVWAGRVLAGIAFLWAALALADLPMGMIDQYKFLLWPLTPIIIALVCIYLDELLAVRALGGIYMLAATPLLAAVRANPTDARIVMSVVAYLMIVCGAFFVMTPYVYRKILEKVMPTPAACRALAVPGLLVGGALLALGLFVYGP